MSNLLNNSGDTEIQHHVFNTLNAHVSDVSQFCDFYSH